ncbi:MAG: crossover junction endodeoxyribonuclease RuvC [Thermomicrobia bacterium]|nr:crossover junction endodeoxyribonuclease RuvC [Thermomicrobia bacterium]
MTLGIDPGTAILGYGVVRGDRDPEVVAYGVVRTESTLAPEKRLLRLYDAVSRLIAEHLPDAVAVEQLFFSKNVTTALPVMQARGVVLLAAASAGLPVSEYRPIEVKQAIAGYGRADKAQMQEMVRILLRLDAIPQPDDAADALAIAICHVHSRQFLAATAQAAVPHAIIGRR